MIRLYKRDWAEIYAALKDKSSTLTCAFDTHCIDHVKINYLKRIMNKIGPDGERAVKRGITKEDDWWSVVLLIPSEIADAFGQDNFFTNIKATSLLDAVEKARWDCKRYIKEPDLELDDLFVVVVIRGKHKDHSHRWAKLQASNGIPKGHTQTS
jgi:hypothetical protein